MLRDIEQFLAEKQIAFVGVSRTEAKYSNKVYQKLKESGHELYPVHPEMESVGSDRCVRNISELPDNVQALMLIASPKVCANVLKDVPGTAIRRIWIFSGKKDPLDIETEIERLKSSGISIISGFCPFMFLEPVNSVHAFHRLIVKLFGKYPK